ncbi:MAG: hypothetical protein Q9223_002257 [Gallowayella weberi]
MTGRDGMLYDNPQFDLLHDTLMAGARLPRIRRWPSSVRFPRSQDSWIEHEASSWNHDWRHHDTHHNPWTQRFYGTLNGAERPDEAFLNHNHLADSFHDELRGAGFPPVDAPQVFRHRGRREDGQSPCCAFQHGSSRFARRRAPEDVRLPFKVNFGCRHSEGNDCRRRGCCDGGGATCGCPGGEREGDGTPHRPRSSSWGQVYDAGFSGLLNWDFETIGGQEASPDAAAVPPPFPRFNLGPEKHACWPEAPEESPSSTPSRHPSSPCSANRQLSPNRQQAYAGHVDLGGFAKDLRRQSKKLKRKRERLDRILSDLLRRAEELRLWETGLQEREAKLDSNMPD